MTDFQKVVLEEVTENLDKLRVPLSSRVRQKLEKIYPYYGAQGIVDYVDDYLFDGEYLLVAEDGENLRSQNQNVCTLAAGKFWVNNHAHILKEKDGNDLKYLYYLLNLVNFRPYVTGSAQPKLTQDSLNNIELAIHTPENQKRISSFLTALDSKISLHNRINAELEALAKTIYDYWFVQFDFPISAALATQMGQPELEGRPYKSSGGKMVYHKELKREVPEGWEADNILAITELLGGGTPSKKQPTYWNGSIPFFTPSDAEQVAFKLNTEDHITEEGLRNSSTKLFPKGTIFITARGSVGNIMIAARDMAMNQSCYAFAPHAEVNYPFAFFSAKSLIGYLKAKSSGSVFKSIVSNDIKYTFLPIPPPEVIRSFGKVALPIFEKILVNLKQNQELASLRDWLLPMLMNGQVRVEEAKEYVQEGKVGMAAERQGEYK